MYVIVWIIVGILLIWKIKLESIIDGRKVVFRVIWVVLNWLWVIVEISSFIFRVLSKNRLEIKNRISSDLWYGMLRINIDISIYSNIVSILRK